MIGMLATYRMVPREGMYTRLFLRRSEVLGLLLPFVSECYCQAANDTRYW